MNLDFRDEVFRSSFSPCADVEEFEARLRDKLGMRNKYESARLCIGRSMAEPRRPDPVNDAIGRGKSIAGEYLFGADMDMWIAAIVMDGDLGPDASVRDFRALVEAHWRRGGLLLRDELQDTSGDETRLMVRLAELLPAADDTLDGGIESSDLGRPGEIQLRVGSVSRTFPEDQEISFTLNGQATAPHIALMGRVGSGKTMTGVQIAQQIVDAAAIPMLFIDPKGEFVDDDRLTGAISAFSVRPNAIEVGHQPIPLDFLPPPGVGAATITQAAMQFRDSIALCCTGVGAIQQDQLRAAVEDVIRHDSVRSLSAIRSRYEQNLAAASKSADSIVARLNELTALNVFEPTMSTADFFGRPWLVSLKALASEELKRLVILLILDALKGFLLAQSDTPVVDGFRTLRHLLVIDEARRILAQAKYQSLVDLIRQGRSKGQVVMLLSQDPSDFDGKADDFMTQLGTIVSFACSQSLRGLKALQGPFGRKLQTQEFSDTQLPAGVAFVKLPGRPAGRVRCWQPRQTSDGTHT
jgi:hypothetical protein